MLGFKRFFNARRVLSGVELVQKIIRGQFGMPESFGTDPFQVWSKRRISLHISARVKLCRKWTVETHAKQNMELFARSSLASTKCENQQK
jgi:hypothetical protein